MGIRVFVVAIVILSGFGVARADDEIECDASARLETITGSRGRIAYCIDGNEKLHGPARQWYPNGVLRASDHWEHGVQSGTWVVWDEVGRKRWEGRFVDGKLHGEEMRWHANGTRRVMTTYHHGLKNGPVRQWDESGGLLARGQFKDDKADGVWTFRHPDSNGFFAIIYREGVKIGQIPSPSPRPDVMQ